MESEKNGIRSKWKMTKMEDNQNERLPKLKTAKIEDKKN